MPDKRGSAETKVLLKAVLARYAGVTAAAEDSSYCISYFYYLRSGQRVASQAFCDWVKSAHPDLKDLCSAVQLSRITD